MKRTDILEHRAKLIAQLIAEKATALWQRFSTWAAALPKTIPEKMAVLIEWCESQRAAYKERRIQHQYAATIRRVILSSPEVYFLHQLYSTVANKRETEEITQGLKCGKVSSIPLETYHKMFGVRGKIRENWLHLLRHVLRIGDPDERAWSLVKQIEELEQRRKLNTCRRGGYFYTKAGKRRKDLPWRLERGSPVMRKAIRRWPGRSLWRISREVEPLLGELYSIMKERGLVEPLNMLTLGLTQSVRLGRQTPMRTMRWWLKDPGLRIKLSAETHDKLFRSGNFSEYSLG